MGFRKTLSEDAASADLPNPETAVETPIAASDVGEPLPDPITAIEQDGTHRPMSGGSFIRQPDGTLTRNPEA